MLKTLLSFEDFKQIPLQFNSRRYGKSYYYDYYIIIEGQSYCVENCNKIGKDLEAMQSIYLSIYGKYLQLNCDYIPNNILFKLDGNNEEYILRKDLADTAIGNKATSMLMNWNNLLGKKMPKNIDDCDKNHFHAHRIWSFMHYYKAIPIIN